MSGAASVPSRLARRLGTADAVVVGLGSMIGAGIFAAFAPAARAAGNGLLPGLAVAALVAYCNATSSAQLAALSPESGGAYVYGRMRLSKLWGFLAGWAYVTGKLASCAAMATTFGSYAAPSHARWLAVAAVVALTAVDYRGIEQTATVTRAIVATVLAALAVVVAAVWLGGATDVGRLWPLADTTLYGVLQAAGFLFFAFAGYARVATLGEEVIDPKRTIPRAIPIALGITLAIYAAVAVSALAGAGAPALAASSAPLATAVEAGRLAWLTPAVRLGASVASLGVLLSLIAGVSRTVFAMAANRDLPAVLAAVHPRHRVPHRAELAVGAVVAVIAAVADIRSAIGFSSFAVLAYYAIANAAACTLAPHERRWPRALAGGGLLGCLLLAVTLPLESVAGGTALLAAGVAAYLWKSRPS
ncbi:MAG TPA: APC family permease [Candidatus Limnocylindria bacterium]|nr:APC family permease [Candidatus Limnocylindria bacterium]